MAHTLKLNTSFASVAAVAVYETVATVGAAIKSFFIMMMEANSRSEEVQHMNNLTDFELAEKYGINRDQIVSYVFRDKIF